MSPRGEIAIPMGGEIATGGGGVNYGVAAVVGPFEIFAAAAPLLRPSAFAAGSFPSSPNRIAVSSPLAIRITLTALPITTAGRLSPLFPAGTFVHAFFLAQSIHITFVDTHDTGI